jgi:hypothetical protein
MAANRPIVAAKARSAAGTNGRATTVSPAASVPIPRKPDPRHGPKACSRAWMRRASWTSRVVATPATPPAATATAGSIGTSDAAYPPFAAVTAPAPPAATSNSPAAAGAAKWLAVTRVKGENTGRPGVWRPHCTSVNDRSVAWLRPY